MRNYSSDGWQHKIKKREATTLFYGDLFLYSSTPLHI